MLQTEEEPSNTLNIQDDHPTFLFVPTINENDDDKCLLSILVLMSMT